MNKIIDSLDDKKYVLIHVQPKYSLRETAKIIQDLFPGSSMYHTDIYDEIPAYISHWNGYEMVLFGIPEGGRDVLDRIIHSYQFKIFPDNGILGELENISDAFSLEFSKLTGIDSQKVN